MKSYENCKVNEWNFNDVPETVWPWDIVVRPPATWERVADDAIVAEAESPVSASVSPDDGARIPQSEASSIR